MLNSFDNNNNKPNPFSGQKLPWWLVGTIMIVALVVVFSLILSLALPHKPQKTEVTIPSAPVKPKASQEKESALPLPRQAFSYIGEIVDISKDKIKISASPLDNFFLKKTKEITADLNDKTEYLKVEFLKEPERDQNSRESFIKTQTISREELKVGDKINLVSSQNVINKTSFQATRIELLQAVDEQERRIQILNE